MSITIPEGWEYHSGDKESVEFWLVTLRRDQKQKKLWHRIVGNTSDYNDWPILHVVGTGKTFETAFRDAIKQAEAIPLLTQE